MGITYAHIISITGGYSAAFLIGMFGIYYVWAKRFHRLSPSRQQSLYDAVHMFGYLALGLVAVGVTLGLFVSKQYFGKYWRWDPKEIGVLCVSAWLIALIARRRFSLVSSRATMLMCIGGNMVVGLAWFGTGILDYARRMHGYRITNCWPLAVFLGINLGFLILDLAGRSEMVE